MRFLTFILASLPLLAAAQAPPAVRFGAPKRYAVGRTPHALAVADVTGDGRPDVLTANWDKSRSTGGGGDNYAMGAGALLPNFRRAAKASDVGSVSILLGLPDGRLGPRRDVPVGRYPDGLAVADLNGDDRLDLAVTGSELPYVSPPSHVRVLLNQGAAGWTTVPLPPDSTAFSPADLAAADLTADGRAEVVAVTRDGNGGYLSTWSDFGQPGQFRALQRHNLAPPHYDPQRVLLADLTGDGRPDAVVANNADFRQDSTLLVLPGRAGGGFGPAQPHPAEWGPVAVGDLDGDGRLDAVSVSAQYRRVWFGTAQGLGAPQRTAQPGLPPLGVLLAELNGDGRPDLITYHYNYNYPTRTPGSVAVRAGLPGGGFGPPTYFGLGFNAGMRLAVADLNGDKRPDLVALTQDDAVLVLLNETP